MAKLQKSCPAIRCAPQAVPAIEGAILRIILLLWVLLLLWVMWGVADWYYDRFVLTNKRIMEVSGIVTRRVAMMLSKPDGRNTDALGPLGDVQGGGDPGEGPAAAPFRERSPRLAVDRPRV